MPGLAIAPGDTWLALSLRFDLRQAELLSRVRAINPTLQPVIGSTLALAEVGKDQKTGKLRRPFAGGLLETAAVSGRSPWTLAIQNERADPFQPLLYAPLFLPMGTSTPKEWPAGMDELLLSAVPAYPGSVLTVIGGIEGTRVPAVSLDKENFALARFGRQFVAVGGSGALMLPGDYLLSLSIEGYPVWSQPWRFAEREWTYEQLNFTGAAAAIEQDAIVAERERLAAIWSVVTPHPLWRTPFSLPLEDYVERTSKFGARRSYGGGPFEGFHEGTDFSAYRGTPVLAPAAGKIVLAEDLSVRGGAVIIDHGLGIFTGYYHLSALHVKPGQLVQLGDLLAEVGTTGRSTGNHLHWDLLANGVHVDAEAWLDSGLDGRILAAWRNFDDVQ